MTSDQFDHFCDDVLNCKTYKELKAVEKHYGKDLKVSMDDLVQTAMKFGREQSLGQIVAHAKDLDDKRGNTLDKRIAKFRKQFKLHFYYHQTQAWYLGFVPAILAQAYIGQLIGLYDLIPNTYFSAPYFDSIASTDRLARFS